MNIPRDLVKDQLRSFINEELGVNIHSLREDLSIEDDLRLSGDDTVDFVMSFAKRFDVDISNLDMRKYSAGEGLLLNFRSLSQKVRGKIKPEITPLTVKILVDAIVSKRLV